MLIGAEGLRAELDFHRIVSVMGNLGAGKDLLCHHLAMPYLRAGYKFYSNQFSVWNDPLYLPSDSSDPYALLEDVQKADGVERLYMRPDIKRRVVVLSEGGRYLRKYEYFEDLTEFARKVDNYFLLPSKRAPHVDLLDLSVYPIVPFKQLLGIEGGVWGYTVETGFRKIKRGTFIFLPERDVIGVYDTKDFTETPNVLLEALRKYITADQKVRGRNGLQTLGGLAVGADEDFQLAIARRAQQAFASVSGRR